MTLRKSRLFLLCLGAVVTLSCTDPSSIAAPETSLRVGPTANTHGRNARLVRCDARPAANAVATIGASGGRITVGPHALTIPRGALRDPVTISAVAPSDTLARIQFQPEGLVFQKPVLLTLDFSDCRDRGRGGREHRIASLDDALRVIGYLRSVEHGSKVTGVLEHFSDYAVAW